MKQRAAQPGVGPASERNDEGSSIIEFQCLDLPSCAVRAGRCATR